MPEDAIGVRPHELVTAEDQRALERDSGRAGLFPDVTVLAGPSSPGRVADRARVQGHNLCLDAVVMVAALLLAGCGASQQTAGSPTVASGQGSNTTPGITCKGGLHFDEALGCTREVAPGEVALRLTWKSEMSRTFVPISAEYALDGRWFYERREAPDTQAGIVGPALYTGVAPGHHVLQARIHYRGYGEGAFSYLTKYHFQIVSTHDFAVTVGALAELMAIAREKPGVQIPIEERPTVHWLEGSDLVDAAAKAEHAAPAATTASACSPLEFGPLPPDRREQQVLGMCRGTVCPFSPQEEELLRFGETSRRPDMVQKARELRRRRLDELSASCSRLRLEGKL